MRLASALFISVSMHAAALCIALSVPPVLPESVAIPVTVLSGRAADESKGLGKPAGRGREAAPTGGARSRSEREQPKESLSDGRGQERIAGAGRAEPPAADQTADRALPAIASISDGTGTEIAGPFVSAGAIADASGGRGSGSGRGWGGSREAGGLGGEGGFGGSGFARVSYAYCPKPDYPAVARSEGWQGTVILRVLVDQEGRSKRIEVSRSSGFDALDQAALETVKSWRFHPARYGQRRVESWVKIPIVFSLAE